MSYLAKFAAGVVYRLSSQRVTGVRASRFAVGCLVLRSVALLPTSGVPVRADPSTVDAARGIIERVLPAHARQIEVEYLPRGADGLDVFEVESRAGLLVLRGNDGVSVGSALNWYLRNVAHAQVSWDGDNLNLPAILPPVPEKVRVCSPYRYRVYLNYCTFNYTASWWDHARWEREIDWMALNGINTPLAITGQEAVWEATLRRFEMADSEIRRFFAGPAFLAWQWMTNMEQWGGPLPQTWIDSHLELGQFIVKRERELGMTPILQGFTGCVPLAFIEKFPAAKILRKKIWCDVGPGTAQIDPGDPLFERFGRAFLEEQARLFGAGHLYACDPFHEGEPPENTPEYLRGVGARLYQVSHDFDPQAEIVMQGWTIREGIVTGIPSEHLLVLDLTGQKWRETKAFWGRPWVAGILHNFGGRSCIGGNLPQLATNAPSLLADPAKGGRLEGIGLFPEAIEQNPLLYGLATDLAWHRRPLDLPAWSHGFIEARYGRDVPVAQRAWARLLNSVYSQRDPAPQMESPLLARPALAMTATSPWGSFERDYDVSQVWAAWAELLDAAPDLGTIDPFRYDLVDVGRQALADLSVPLQRALTAAWGAGDRSRFAAAKARFLELGVDLDTLLATRREFLLGPWIADARRWGTTPAEADLYERNARLLITVWGPPEPKAYIFDYACHQWSGLVRDFYLERWRKYFAYLERQPADYRDDKIPRSMNRPDNDSNDFYRALSQWEYAWCDGHEACATEPQGDSVAVSRALLAKWTPVMRDTYPRFDWRALKFARQN